MNNHLCILPWISLETSPLGDFRPCCLALESIKDADGVPLSAVNTDLQTAANSQYMRNLRKSFIQQEKPATCNRCWDEEAAGRVSKRMNSYSRLRHLVDKINFTNPDDTNLIFLDLKLGNICNLKCRICGSFSSSKWAQEEIDIQKKWPIEYKNSLPHQHLHKGQWPRNNKDFWQDLLELLPSIRYLEFTGGEPFLINEHFELLQSAVDQGYAKNIEIHYNTNGTTFPSQGLKLWPHFKLVEIAFSIDDIGARFEYQRFGAKWETVNQNIQKFQELKKANSNIVLQHCLTVNVFNIFYLKELFPWMLSQQFDSTYFNVLHDAWYFSIRSLPDKVKQKILERYQHNIYFKDEVDNLLTFMMQGQSSDGSDLRRVTEESDQHRQQHLADNHYELAELINYAKTR